MTAVLYCDWPRLNAVKNLELRQHDAPLSTKFSRCSPAVAPPCGQRPVGFGATSWEESSQKAAGRYSEELLAVTASTCCYTWRPMRRRKRSGGAPRVAAASSSTAGASAACCLSQLSAGNMAVTWPEIIAVSKYWTSREETDTHDSSEQQKLMLHISAPREPR